MKVRRAVTSDIEDVVMVGHRTWPPTYEPIAGAQYVRDGLAKWWTAESALPAILDGRTLVAEVSAGVVGMASWSTAGDVLTLWKLYVEPTYQGHGAGSALLEAVVLEAKEAQARAIRLAYLSGNGAAERFYERHGFAVVGREPGALSGPDNVWMERNIS